MTVVSKIQSKLTKVYAKLNQRGVNSGGRLAAKLELWAPTATSTNKMKHGALALVADSEVDLVPIEMRRGEIVRFDEKLGAKKVVGDARLKIARHQPDDTPLNLDQLSGKGLEVGQELRVRLGDELYTVVRGGVEDPADGFSWFITLKRVES